MDEEIKAYQDKMVEYVLEAKKLQNKSQMEIGLKMEGNSCLVPVDMILKSLLKMTTRQDLKEKIYKSQTEI